MKYLIIFFLILVPLSVNGQCHADFEPYDTVWPAVLFLNLSQGSFNKSYWTFGDGQTSVYYDPTNYYQKIGTYNVCLKISGDSCNDSICKEITLRYPCPQETYFEFRYESYGDSIKFVPNGDYFNLNWDFGDGQSSYDLVPSHVYADTGTYNVCAIAVNYDTTCSDTICHIIHVGSPGLTANFSYKITGRFVEFYDHSTKDDATPFIDTRFWNFGDNDSTSMWYSDSSIYHYYQSSGKYNVCYRIEDWTQTHKSVYCDSVEIDSIACRAYFQITDDAYCFGGPVSLVNSSEFGNDPSWTWSYGDTIIDTLYQPGDIYLQNFPYDGQNGICLYAIDSTGCEDKYCQPLPCPGAVKDQKSDEASLEVFPNPVKSMLTIRLKVIKNDPINIKIFNSSGLLIKEVNLFNEASIQLNVDNYNKGIYMLLVQSDKKLYSKKFVIR